MNILICDDDGSIAETVRRHTESYMLSRNIIHNIAVFSSAEMVLKGYRLKPDICLLDIEMPGMNGIDLSTKLLKVNEKAVFVYVTNHYDYINHVIRSSNISGYLHKSRIDREFAKVIDDAVKMVYENRRSISVTGYDRLPREICVKDIMAVYIKGGMVKVLTTKTEYRVSNKFNEIRDFLEPFDFNMAAAKIIVNNKYVKNISGKTCFIASDGKNEMTVTISKRYYREFVSSYEKYMLKEDD